MADASNLPRACMRMANSQLKLEQVQAAMKAMMDEAQATSDTPVCMAIVDASGNLEAFAKMDGARVFTRRHAIRKAYTAAVLGIDTIVVRQRARPAKLLPVVRDSYRLYACNQLIRRAKMGCKI